MDKEKIIAAMEWCRENPCKGCPYEQNKDAEGRCTIGDDTIILLKELKEQEAVEPIMMDHMVFGTSRKCSKCNQALFPAGKYCPHCGRPVKWE